MNETYFLLLEKEVSALGKELKTRRDFAPGEFEALKNRLVRLSRRLAHERSQEGYEYPPVSEPKARPKATAKGSGVRVKCPDSPVWAYRPLV